MSPGPKDLSRICRVDQVVIVAGSRFDTERRWVLNMYVAQSSLGYEKEDEGLDGGMHFCDKMFKMAKDEVVR